MSDSPLALSILAAAIRGLAFTSDNAVNLAALNDSGILNIYESVHLIDFPFN